MENIINEFRCLINEFDQKLALKYGTNSPWNQGFKVDKLPKKGIIGDYEYNFHGSGCDLVRDDVSVSYDRGESIGTNYMIQFSIWSISQFVQSHPKYNGKYSTDEEIKSDLEILVKKGILSKLEIEGKVFEVYKLKS